ncbi:putative transcription factor interactor and regulator CCHC(Zn) family [Helianthus anomalus]
MELMKIKWAFASVVRRAVKCFKCGERGHFKRECMKPPQYGNQNPFRNRTNQSNQNSNHNNNVKRAMVPIENANQAGSSNTNNTRALVV